MVFYPIKNKNLHTDSTVTFVKYDTGVLFGDSNQLLNGMVLSAQVSQKTVKDVNSAVTLKIKVCYFQEFPVKS